MTLPLDENFTICIFAQCKIAFSMFVCQYVMHKLLAIGHHKFCNFRTLIKFLIISLNNMQHKAEGNPKTHVMYV